MAAPLGAASSSSSVAAAQQSGTFMITPDNSGAKLNTADWPLLLKNYVSGSAAMRVLD